MQKFREAALGKKSLKTESVPRFSSALSLKCHTSARQKRGQPTEETSNGRFGVICSFKLHWMLAYRPERTPTLPPIILLFKRAESYARTLQSPSLQSCQMIFQLKKIEKNWERRDTYLTKQQNYWSSNKPAEDKRHTSCRQKVVFFPPSNGCFCSHFAAFSTQHVSLQKKKWFI